MRKLNTKRLNFFFVIALSTFALGVFVVRLFQPLSQSKEAIEIVYSYPQAFNPPLQLEANSPEEIQIILEEIWLVENEYVGQIPVAKFRIINKLKKPIYYMGYSPTAHCAYQFTIKGKKIKQYPLCTCGTGLAERILPAGETQILQLNLPDKVKGDFEAEFEFSVGNERRKEKVRVKGIVSY